MHSISAAVPDIAGMYLANQLDGKIFKDPSLLPSRAAYSQFVQTKVGWRPAVAHPMQVRCLPTVTAP